MNKETRIEQAEKAKYEKIYSQGSYRSQSAEPFALLLKNRYDLTGLCLDIGCGDAATVNILRDFGIDIRGVDITLDGAKAAGSQLCLLYEAPAWNMGWPSRHFDYTFSTDLLEHIPTEMVVPTIREIARITKVCTIHQIATFPMRDEHLTVRAMVAGTVWAPLLRPV